MNATSTLGASYHRSRLVVAFAGVCSISTAEAVVTRDLAVSPGELVVWGGVEETTGLEGVAVADVDCNGTLDIVFAQQGWRDSADRTVGRIGVLLNPSLPVVHDLLVSSPDVSIIGEPDFNVGHSLSVGDIDGDSCADLVLGSTGGLRPRAGQVAVFLGRRTWPAELGVRTSDWRFFGAESEDRMYESVVGDVNCDDSEDLVLFATRADGIANARVDSGEAYVFFGPSTTWPATDIDLATISPDVVIYGADGVGDNPVGASGDLLGEYGIAAIGQVIDDACRDLVIAAWGGAGVDNTKGSVLGAAAGEVYVLSGRVGWPTSVDLRAAGAAAVTVYGSRTEERLRDVVIADWNTDGIADLVFGTMGTGLRERSGAVVVVDGTRLSGQLDLTSFVPDGIVIGPRVWSGVGSPLAFGDVNGDGFGDIVMGAPGEETPFGRPGAGAVFVVSGCGGWVGTIDLATSEPAMVLYGASAADGFGDRLAGGDVDMDGKWDILGAAANSRSRNDSRGLRAGEVHLVLGRDFEAQCSAVAEAGGDEILCPGERKSLDGSGSAIVGCSGAPEYRWEDSVGVIADWSVTPAVDVFPVTTTSYRLRVRCGGCVGGVCSGEDEVTVMVADDSIPGDQGNVLRSVRNGNDVSVFFPGASAPSWRLYRDTDKSALGTTALTPDASTTDFTDPGAVPGPPNLYFYRLKGLSPCSQTPGP